jgi:hypothetical protein
MNPAASSAGRTEALCQWKVMWVWGVLKLPSGCKTLTVQTFPADAAIGLLSHKRLALWSTLIAYGMKELVSSILKG